MSVEPEKTGTVTLNERFRGCLAGLAAGDAVGTTVEFCGRNTFEPLTDMVGGGPFDLEPGQWTDDTSMALCLAASLVECRGFDPVDQMHRYCRWRNHGYMSSNGRCFDIGMTVNAALDRFTATSAPYSGSTDPRSAGNGSIMRLAPVVLHYFPDAQAIAHYAALSSRTTHAAAESVDGCVLLAEILRRCLAGMSRAAVIAPVSGDWCTDATANLADGTWTSKRREDVRGTGYVVESLEAALWCFAHTQTFEAAILAAANLGDDADTTAAICGQMAGAFYGCAAIPRAWRERLAMAQEIERYADCLLDNG